jgi:hypothetical protein
MELKISGKDDDEAPLAQKALDQILENGYANLYNQPHLLGIVIVINDKKRPSRPGNTERGRIDLIRIPAPVILF